MKLFMCFGGAAAVVDDDAADEAVVPARHRAQRRRLSFRGKFLSGNGRKKKPSSVLPSEAKKQGVDADDVYGVIGEGTASVASSAPLSSAESLDSASSSSSRSSTASSWSSSTFSEVLPPTAVKRQAKGSSPAAGAAAVVLCLLMVVFCGRVGATLLTSTALYLFPRRWPATVPKADDEEFPESDAVSVTSSEAVEETVKRKVWLWRGSW